MTKIVFVEKNDNVGFYGTVFLNNAALTYMKLISE